jgi:hypothetical protein
MQLVWVPKHVLVTGVLSQVSVAQKISWAANRITARVEDRAYSLLGLFGVHTAMLYGEGENAFLRLQEVIPRTTSEDSIFSWQPEKLGLLWFTRKIFRKVPALWRCSPRGAYRYSNLEPWYPPGHRSQFFKHKNTRPTIRGMTSIRYA